MTVVPTSSEHDPLHQAEAELSTKASPFYVLLCQATK